MGKRIENFTNKPKCLLTYKNKTFIENIIEDLIKLNIPKAYIAVGFKSHLIKSKINKYKNKINIKYIKIDNYNLNGSSYSWCKIESYWIKNKSNIIFIHADLVYEFELLKKIFFTNSQNIIGVVKKKMSNIRSKGFIVDVDNKNFVKSISYKNKSKKKYGFELACINKINIENQKKIFNFFKFFFKKYSKRETWEIPLNILIKNKKLNFKINKPKKYFWNNVNTYADYKKIKF